MYRVEDERANRGECYQSAKDEWNRKDDAVRDACATIAPI
jgi:hypothetical protein